MARRFVLAILLVAGTFSTAPASAQVIAFDKPGLGFAALAGGASPAPQTIAVTNRAAPALTWRIPYLATGR